MNDGLRDGALDAIRALTGQNNVISVPRAFVTLFDGDYTRAVLLNQILYWSDRTTNPNGWFYKSYDEWTDELGLSKYQVMRAMHGDKRTKSKSARTLADVGIETDVRHTLKGKPTVHYRIDADKFMGILIEHVKSEKAKSSAKVNNVDEPKLTLQTLDSQQSQRTYTEITTETTAEEQPARAIEPEVKPAPMVIAPKPEPEFLPERPNAFALYENTFGVTITYTMAQVIKDALTEFTAEWVEDALKEAAVNNAKSWRYVEKVLDRWKREGRRPKVIHIAQPPKLTYIVAPPPDDDDYVTETKSA